METRKTRFLQTRKTVNQKVSKLPIFRRCVCCMSVEWIVNDIVLGYVVNNHIYLQWNVHTSKYCFHVLVKSIFIFKYKLIKTLYENIANNYMYSNCLYLINLASMFPHNMHIHQQISAYKSVLIVHHSSINSRNIYIKAVTNSAQNSSGL